MESINEKILEDYRLLVCRLDIMKGDLTDQTRAKNKLLKAFIELLYIYQLELDRRNSFEDRQEVQYYWLEKAGILD